MSRRDKLSGIFADTSAKLAAANFTQDDAESRVLAGPVRTMGLTLDRMEQESRELKEALKSGESIVELDPDLIDVSFAQDRLDVVVNEDDDLVRSIRENGQELPILVRLHPQIEGRYQVAYGHRRLKAMRLLKRKIKAVIKPLSDSELVIAQGIENEARKNLSYIERAMFALNLEDQGFARSVIMQALNTDKTELSKLITIARSIPQKVIVAIGAAPGTGRRKWQELSELAAIANKLRFADRAIEQESFELMSSDERFAAILESMTSKSGQKPKIAIWKPADGLVSGKIRDTGKAYSLVLKTPEAEGFGPYLTERLDQLYADWMQTKNGE